MTGILLLCDKNNYSFVTHLKITSFPCVIFFSSSESIQIFYFFAVADNRPSFLFRYNKFHEAAFMNVAGEFTGSINQRYSKVEYYFQLKKINEQLAAENARLNQMLKENYERPKEMRK